MLLLGRVPPARCAENSRGIGNSSTELIFAGTRLQFFAVHEGNRKARSPSKANLILRASAVREIRQKERLQPTRAHLAREGKGDATDSRRSYPFLERDGGGSVGTQCFPPPVRLRNVIPAGVLLFSGCGCPE